MRTRPLLALSFAATLSLGLSGCPLGGQSRPARAQEAALELNLNARFGRMELAAERVAPKARDAFFDRRKQWGGAIRVADYDMTGLRMQGEDEAETFVKVAWYRANEGDLRVTTLKQKWHDFKGDWKLTDETRIDGDVGLLGEPMPARTSSGGPPQRTQFPTITLGTGRSLDAVDVDRGRQVTSGNAENGAGSAAQAPSPTPTTTTPARATSTPSVSDPSPEAPR